MRSPLFLFSVLLFPTPALALQSVLIVDDDGGAGVFTDLQPAIDAAAEGDVLLVKEGCYAPFVIDGKSLIVQADDSNVEVTSANDPAGHVLNLAPAQRVVLRGLNLLGGDLVFGPFPPALLVDDCSGNVWVESCDLRGSAGGAFVHQSAAVVFLGSRLAGRQLLLMSSLEGGPGLGAVDSFVHVHDSILEGGTAASVKGVPAGDGGAGAFVNGGFLFAAGTQFKGGGGGQSISLLCLPGDGGPGLLLVGAAPDARTMDSTFEGGPPGSGLFCTGLPGANVIVASGMHTLLPGTALSMRSSSPVRAGQNAGLTLSGPPGVPVLLGVSRAATGVFLPLLDSSLLIGAAISVQLVGLLPPSGSLSLSFPVAPLGPGVAFEHLYGQSAYVDAVLGPLLGEGSDLLVLDAAL